LVQGDQVASTDAGYALQTEQLAKQAKKSFGALLTVAILQTVFGAVIVAVSSNAQPIAGGTQQGAEQVSVGVLSITVFGIATVFFGLAFWARKNPLPASIVGLVLFVSVHLLDALVDPTSIIRGILVKIIIISILVKAISAGVRHRALTRSVSAA
jgi:hypothetical protein